MKTYCPRCGAAVEIQLVFGITVYNCSCGNTFSVKKGWRLNKELKVKK